MSRKLRIKKAPFLNGGNGGSKPPPYKNVAIISKASKIANAGATDRRGRRSLQINVAKLPQIERGFQRGKRIKNANAFFVGCPLGVVLCYFLARARK